MEKRVILAFVLSFAVLYVYQALYTQPPPVSETQQTAPAPSAPAPTPATLPPTPPSAESLKTPPPKGEVRAGKAEEFAFDTPLYTATVSNLGAVLKSFRLKQYTDEQGMPLELIDQEAGNAAGWPLAMASGDKTIDDQLRTALFLAKKEEGQIQLEFASNGVYARKSIQFDTEAHQFKLDTTLAKDGKALPHSVVWQGSFGDQSKGPDGQPLAKDPAKKNALYQSDSSFTRVALPSVEETQSFATLRVGVEDQYFVAMFRSSNPFSGTLAKQEIAGPDGKPIPLLVVSAAKAPDERIDVYVGPKQEDWLGKADAALTAVQDYGIFEFIAKPLLRALLWINGYISNFGWSIIVLTVVINLIIFPLRLKQQVSMLKMQKIQPHMRRLQDQYKKLKPNDPRRTEVQSEMMGLYKQHGVNPMGGCLPLLLQMPFFLGFYSALAYSIELRRAPWVLWIKDLSQYDPSYLLPILMAVAMIAQQKLTPTANLDPAQARMMMIMPVVMTFLFLRVSSGLALYWLTGSVVGVVQQVFMNKYWAPKAEAKISGRPRPPERRGT